MVRQWRNIKNILVDIDGTLVYDNYDYAVGESVSRPPYPTFNYFQKSLVDTLSRNLGISPEEALTAVEEAEKPCGRTDAFFAIDNRPEWKRYEEEFRRRAIEWQEEYLSVFDDGVQMVRALKAGGFRLFIASNNGVRAIHLKLARAGLRAGGPAGEFTAVFGDDLTGCQKGNPQFYRRLLELIGIDPQQTVMIGDNYEQDYLVPKSAGLEKVVIVDRMQKEIVKDNGALFANDLRAVMDILRSGRHETAGFANK